MMAIVVEASASKKKRQRKIKSGASKRTAEKSSRREEQQQTKKNRQWKSVAAGTLQGNLTDPEFCRGNRPLMTVTIERVVEKWVGNVDQLYESKSLWTEMRV